MQVRKFCVAPFWTTPRPKIHSDHTAAAMADNRDAAAASSAYALSETVNRVHQDQLYDQRMQLKRAAPTPAASSAATPQGETPVATTGTVVVVEPERVQPVTLDDHTAFQATASAAGVNINDPSQVEAYAQQQVKTVQDVFNVVRSYHTAVVRPEMRGMIKQLEYSIRKVEDSVFSCQRELQFMVTENRSTQKHASGLMLVTTGWPNELGPEKRVYMLGWMLSNTPEVVKHLQNMGLLANPCDHTALKPQFWFNILAQDPVTVPQSAGRYSGMTLLTFKAWEMRSAFLKQFGGQSGTPLYIDEATPQPNRHVRVSPCTPQWQRKLEMPLRVLIQALNNHPETTGKRLVILWKTLTIMAPTEDRDFSPDHTAWARLFYEQSGGSFKARLEVSREFASILTGPPQVPGKGEESFWSECWNNVIWGSQLEHDDAERAAYHTAKLEALSGGKGTSIGKGKRHWSNALLHNSTYSPYPFDLEFVAVDAVAFVWDEFCDKSGKESEKIGSYEMATYQGKPAAPAAGPSGHTADMDVDSGAPAAARPAKGAMPPPAKSKGRGLPA